MASGGRRSRLRRLERKFLGLGEIGFGLRVVALLLIGEATAPIGRGETRIEFDGTVKVGHGLVQVAPGVVNTATAEIRLARLRGEPNGIGKVGDGRAVVALPAVDQPRPSYASAYRGLSQMASVKSAMALSYSPFPV